ncbi:prepilin peptidase [Streptococcus sp. DD13]|uniref:prepilin peptidase n=1 Tax=Streptococcus sp. DD13 TaxID=1777881 RepID=UPI000796C257|nr:Late competence protein ComC, processing protease [Streptococcus sp. DD13]
MNIVLLSCLGASLGSFLGVIIDRFPHTSILSPASHCDHCQHRLNVWDLIPILSQLSLGFRCRYCKERTPFWYAGLELCLMLITLFLYEQILSIPQALVWVLSLLLSLYDLKNKSYPLFIWFGLTALTTCFTGIHHLFLILIGMAYLTEKLSLNIGAGDFLYLASLSLIQPLYDLVWTIQFASFSALVVYFFLKNKREPLPFVPFLFAGFLMSSLLGLGF